VRLISTGVSPYDSGLLSVSHDGKDALFFTRDQLVPEDENLLSTRVYDAREDGGLFVVPSSPPCAASDECHGPGTVAAAPSQIGTFEGVGGQYIETKRCNAGALGRKAKKNSRRAKQLRRKATKSSAAQQRRRLRKRANHFARRARKLNRQAKQCRRSRRGKNR